MKYNPNKHIRIIIIVLAVCFAVVYVSLLAPVINKSDNPLQELLILAVIFVFIKVATKILYVIYEIGYLVFGLFTGYEFVSFQVGHMFVTTENGKIRFSHAVNSVIACTMDRPADRNNHAYFLFNAGGIILIFLTIVICHILLPLVKSDVVILFLGMMAYTGWTNGLSRAIPAVFDYPNDGMRILELRKYPSNIEVVMKNMELIRKQQEGLRIRDADDSLIVTDEEILHNGYTGSIGIVVAVTKLMDRHEFDKAKELIERIRQGDYLIAPLYLNFKELDYRFIQMLEGTYNEDEESTDFKEFLKKKKSFNNVQRYLFAKALYLNDETMRQEAEKNMDKISKTNPYKADMETEIELMNIARERLTRH